MSAVSHLSQLTESEQMMVAHSSEWTPTDAYLDFLLFETPYPEVTILTLKRDDWVATTPQVLRGLQSTDSEVRRFWVKKAPSPLDSRVVDAALSDKESLVVVALVKRTDWTATTEQCYQLLHHESWMVASEWIKRTDWTPTPEDVLEGLKSRIPYVKLKWLEREDIHIPEDMIYELLQDENYGARIATVYHPSCPASLELAQMTMDLIQKHIDEVVNFMASCSNPNLIKLDIFDLTWTTLIKAWLKKSGWTPDAKMIQNGLSCKIASVRKVWEDYVKAQIQGIAYTDLQESDLDYNSEIL